MDRNEVQLYDIVETVMYPNSWKLVAVGCRDDNSTCNYFPTPDAALEKIIRLKGEFRNLVKLKQTYA